MHISIFQNAFGNKDNTFRLQSTHYLEKSLSSAIMIDASFTLLSDLKFIIVYYTKI